MSHAMTLDAKPNPIVIDPARRAVIFTGCTTSVCVESTLRDAYFRDYQSVLLTDCIDEPIGQGLPRTNHDASVLLVEMLFGWVATSEQFLSACSFDERAAIGRTSSASL